MLRNRKDWKTPDRGLFCFPHIANTHFREKIPDMVAFAIGALSQIIREAFMYSREPGKRSSTG
jgi:hypothetical protein